jgi:hypothetical protein
VSQVTKRVCASLCQAASHTMCIRRKEGDPWESYLDCQESQLQSGEKRTMSGGRMKSTGTARDERERRITLTRDRKVVASFINFY